MFYPRKQKIHAGFSLVELLVVIAIIGILATTVVLALQGSKEKARNAKRVSDVREMMNALHIYFNTENTYPDGTDLVLNDMHLCTGGTAPGWVAGACDTDQERVLVAAAAPLPPDNQGGTTVCDETNNAYTYTVTDGGAGFEIRYCLGSAVADLIGGLCVGDEETLHCP
jgi:prepilin-type N-terminal cleavage/methylation domain-containing protein